MDDENRNLFDFKLLLWIGICMLVLLLPGIVIGQDCPEFEIRKIVNTSDGQSNGSIEIAIRSSVVLRTEHFEIRQKEKQVTGPIGYDAQLSVTSEVLKIEGLRSSDEMILDEYVILFSDQRCDRGKLVEVVAFEVE